MRFSASAFAPACASPNPCEADPLRLYPDASGGEAAVTRYRVFPGMELDYRDVHARACRELRDGSGEPAGDPSLSGRAGGIPAERPLFLSVSGRSGGSPHLFPAS